MRSAAPRVAARRLDFDRARALFRQEHRRIAQRWANSISVIPSSAFDIYASFAMQVVKLGRVTPSSFRTHYATLRSRAVQREERPEARA